MVIEMANRIFYVPYFNKEFKSITTARRYIMNNVDTRYYTTDYITFNIVSNNAYVEKMKYASGRFGWVSNRGKPNEPLKEVNDKGRLTYSLDKWSSDNIKRTMK